MAVQPNFKKLKTQLSQSKIKADDPALFQLITQLLDYLAKGMTEINETIVTNSSVVNAINELTGDVTAGPGSGSQIATIPNDTVTYAKIQNVSTEGRLLGRGRFGPGDVTELTVGPGLDFIGNVLDVTNATDSDWDVLTDGDLIEPELIFAGGEVIMLEIP